MAIGKTTGCLILTFAACASAAQFSVRHEHWRHGCEGILKVDETGVSFEGPKGHAWSWKLQEIQELRLAPRSIHILTYKDSKLRLGADQGYSFTGNFPAEDLHALLRDRMDQRLVAEVGHAPTNPAFSIPVKHLGRIAGSEGTLAFTADAIVYDSPARNQSRTWRYSDIDAISSSGRFQLTITTPEKGFNFQLKQPITEARYNELWLQIEKKNGRIQ
jgi:hypothetical protein